MLNTFCSDLLKYMLKHILLHLIPKEAENRIPFVAIRRRQEI